ncbi:MAG: FAD-dependent oxidoreductase, partial [Acidimicrobiia bacterium]|nr:FAD-dependent oxidoreductase [Acidimicrobiia bacterium]
MTHTIVVGDGPGGLSAALFLAKNGSEVTVYGKDETAMHFAYLHNYLGIDEISGSDFQERAREQATSVGAELHDIRVTSVTSQ